MRKFEKGFDIMKLVISSTNGEIELDGVKESEIYINKGLIFFRSKAAVNLNNFLSYRYVDVK